MQPYAIETEALTRRFDDKLAVDRLDLKVPSATIAGFLGLNGAGKTTTIRMLATLLAPSAGRARILGHDVVREADRVRRCIGLVAEADAGTSKPTWTALEYLDYFSILHGLGFSKSELVARLDALHVSPDTQRRQLRDLSTGTRRRVEIARALLGNPKVLFLDEPSRGLDLPAKRELWTVLTQLVARERLTVFLSSHDALEIQGLCQRILVLANGRLIFDGTSKEVGIGASFEGNLIRLLQGQAPASRDRATAPVPSLMPVRAKRKLP